MTQRRTAREEVAEQARQADIDRQIIEGYTRHPPTAEETAWASSGGFTGLSDDDWHYLR